MGRLDFRRSLVSGLPSPRRGAGNRAYVVGGTFQTLLLCLSSSTGKHLSLPRALTLREKTSCWPTYSPNEEAMALTSFKFIFPSSVYCSSGRHDRFVCRRKVCRLYKNTRNSQLLDIPLFRTASGQRTFQYRATSLWNELQPVLKLSPSVTAFKRLLRQKLLNDCLALLNFSF